MLQNYKDKWNECLAFIKDNVGEHAFKTWFDCVDAVSFDGRKLYIKIPTHFYFEMYESEYYDVLRAALKKVFGPEVVLGYEVPIINGDNESIVKLPSQEKSQLLTNKMERENFHKPAIVGKTVKERDNFDPQLNPLLNFNNYCVGESNKLPYTIAEYISRNPRNSAFNPFFLYGDVGVGKTHLIQAIGIKIKEDNPKAKVLFTTMKQFQTLYANAAITKKIPSFINWFMQMDVLLIDDLQEITRKIKTANDALFPIFNHLHQNGRQLVFTCDRPPMELDGVADRLIDRFKWGITEKLPRPDADLRKKILTLKAHHNGLDLSEEVIDYIAENTTTSVRELEGIVTGILLRSTQFNAPIDMTLTKEVMKNFVKVKVKKPINFDMIVESTAEFFNLNPDVIFSKSRVRDVSDARQIIMYLSEKLTGLSSVAIGHKLNRAHTTVLHGIDAVRKNISNVPDVANAVEAIEATL